MNNKTKFDLLGEPYGTASAKLKKAILFKLVQILELNICFQCGKKIESVDDLSVEHKAPWQSAKDPRSTFYDLDNIAFSHLDCNSKAANRKVPRPNNRGERNGGAKLTKNAVQEIRTRLSSGETSYKIAKELGMEKRSIYDIENRLSWKEED